MRAAASRFTSWALALGVLVTGCGASEPASELDFEPPPIAVSAAALSSIDCTEHGDTGYTQGSPFPITVVTVDGKPVERDTANAYYVMAQAADAAGVTLAVVSGFRTMAEQQYLYNCYVNCNCNNCNLAAKPGYSNHQSGHALDLNTAAGGVLSWLNANGGNFGFARTVPSEAWHWEWWGGGPGGGPCGNKLPGGSLDGAGCDGVTGWAQDPDEPTKSIDAHLYFGGPAGSGAPGKAVNANLARPDLCGPLGSCEHAFDVKPPLSLFDGQPHAVHAYAIDSVGGPNAEIGGSPKDLTCTATLPNGVRRHVQNPESLAAWKLDLFWQKLPLTDDQIQKLVEATPLPLAPLLVQADDGSPEVWLVDGAFRRHVPDPAALAAWSFSVADIQSTPAAEVAALIEGPPLRPAPVLVADTSGKVDLIDDPLPGTGGSAGAPATTGGTGGGSGGALGGAAGAVAPNADDANANIDGSCACNSAGKRRSPPWALALIALALWRRRKVGTELGRPGLLGRRASTRLIAFALASSLSSAARADVVPDVEPGHREVIRRLALDTAALPPSEVALFVHHQKYGGPNPKSHPVPFESPYLLRRTGTDTLSIIVTTRELAEAKPTLEELERRHFSAQVLSSPPERDVREGDRRWSVERRARITPEGLLAVDEDVISDSTGAVICRRAPITYDDAYEGRDPCDPYASLARAKLFLSLHPIAAYAAGSGVMVLFGAALFARRRRKRDQR